MSAFTYPAKFSTGSDGRVLVEFVDLPHVATDGKNLSEAMFAADYTDSVAAGGHG
jgi:predicted RNase H-like HicB family nuclease